MRPKPEQKLFSGIGLKLDTDKFDPIPPGPSRATLTNGKVPKLPVWRDKDFLWLVGSQLTSSVWKLSVGSVFAQIHRCDYVVQMPQNTHQLLWRCPTKQHLLPLYQQHFWQNKYESRDPKLLVSKKERAWEIRHLDIGAGTGYFCAKALQQCLTVDSAASREPMKITSMDVNRASLNKAKKRVEGVFERYKRGSMQEHLTVQGKGLAGWRARYTLWLYNRVYRVFGNEGIRVSILRRG
ncbi:hypothetical protein B0T21DRAFT_396240 [Apiosordaria backusii]|uniref:Methyltransferase domain-containing protein n=1 Tax=Apiosordaria backusii TaxID=314023 RepID=A0AA40AJ22_9PEZI|nr:hypothetical protein B0T21DRAFT_396240 [Apiosordaria backusii]